MRFATTLPLLLVLAAGCAAQSDTHGHSGGKADGTDSIPDQVQALKDEFPNDRVFAPVMVRSTDPLSMIKEYVYALYTDDAPSFTFVTNGTFDDDTATAGTVTADAARDQVHMWLAAQVQNNGWDMATEFKKADDIMDAILAAGGSFGFDGYGQNGCAVPTITLLVMDPAAPSVSAVDLNPCME
jgi:hypothetical protein